MCMSADSNIYDKPDWAGHIVVGQNVTLIIRQILKTLDIDRDIFKINIIIHNLTVDTREQDKERIVDVIDSA